jgi:hypothetical protein
MSPAPGGFLIAHDVVPTFPYCPHCRKGHKSLENLSGERYRPGTANGGLPALAGLAATTYATSG